MLPATCGWLSMLLDPMLLRLMFLLQVSVAYFQETFDYPLQNKLYFGFLKNLAGKSPYYFHIEIFLRLKNNVY